uniref:Adenosine receptor A2a-like n=1 Tax=Saccoglossus kowalevskii TaxID=10224 RepID=A0ABM0MT58_SACKO|nr:PREDICTED: adenosine receptor A2a-like [Saccoglossus kowalevskii]
MSTFPSTTTTTTTTAYIADIGLEEYHDFEWYYLAIVALVAVAIILENLAVLLCIGLNKKLQSIDNYCIINLACADLFNGIVFIFHVTFTVIRPYSCTNVIYCGVIFSAQPVAVVGSVLALMTMSIDRYISVSYTLKYTDIVTGKRFMLIVVVQWIVSIILGSMPVMIWHTEDIQACINVQILSDAKSAYLWYWLITFLPTVILLILYGRLFCVAYRHARRVAPRANQIKRNQTHNTACELSTINLPTTVGDTVESENSMEAHSPTTQRKKLHIINRAYKAVITLGIIMICMVCTFLPLQVMFISFNCENCFSISHFDMRAIMLVLQVSNSAMNPFVYAIRIKELRNTFVKTMKTIFLCKCRKQSVVNESPQQTDT